MYENIGIKVKKYHRAVKFTPERWMKPYIEKKNTQLKQTKKVILNKISSS